MSSEITLSPLGVNQSVEIDDVLPILSESARLEFSLAGNRIILRRTEEELARVIAERNDLAGRLNDTLSAPVEATDG